MAARSPKLLLSFVYYNPVGHLVEALKYAKGLADANPGTEVHLLHRADAPIELADGCSWISGTFPVDLRADPAVSLGAVPQRWDWVVEDGLIELESEIGRGESEMLAFALAARAYFVARRGKGILYPERRLPEGLQYTANAPIRIELPSSLSPGKAHQDGPTLGVMLGGSAGYSHYPSVGSWLKILRAVEHAYPSARIVLTGVTRSVGGRTSSTYTEANIRTLLRGLDRTSAQYDVGIWQQLALLESCDAFLSPHTGFAFLALCVGTPWVTISGGDWPEWFFNEVPFYSVLPDNPDYPYQGKLDKYRHWTKIPCMEPARLEARIPEILEGLRLVLDPEFTYEAALQRHEQNVASANVRRDAIPLTSTF